MNQPNTLLPNERLIAYRLALEFHARVATLARARGLASLRDQLLRAVDSIVLNIAEGAGRTSRDDKRRFYDIALGSLTECAAVLDCLRNRAANPPRLPRSRHPALPNSLPPHRPAPVRGLTPAAPAPRAAERLGRVGRGVRRDGPTRAGDG